MLQNYSKTNTIFYLIDVTETNGEYFASPLAKQWNSSAFMKVGTPENAHKFQDKAAAQKMANLQNMMNEAFGSTSRVYVVEGATTNTLYNDKGDAIEPDSVAQKQETL